MIPILITMDLEIANDYDFESQKEAINQILTDFKKEGINFTIFTTADAAIAFNKEIRAFQSSGNEIGCHGLAHRPEENYKHLDSETIRKYIKESTRQIKETTGKKPVSFRGPRMTTSSSLQKTLIEEGYQAELSVCSQRFDIFNSKGGSISWLTAPRKPYNPSPESPYKKGNLELLEIPLTAFIFPFISGMLYIAGLNFMKMLFKLFYTEAKHREKPIVYLFHSYEFSEYTGFKNGKSTGSERSTYSVQRFYGTDKKKRYEANLDLIKYMKSFEQVGFITSNKYIEYFNERKGL